ncbi:hypothetical protein [Parvularcula maris]|uniref:Uncharacterized protein n=1 Tax=Parvularcula maris TaxID=2965077 RepID=A0A9X2RL42_9PROT|nr:hypothetical protein [Parvularcula maris]MCQ8186438.1 hypothetical protein [Parvularcula maris]
MDSHQSINQPTPMDSELKTKLIECLALMYVDGFDSLRATEQRRALGVEAIGRPDPSRVEIVIHRLSELVHGKLSDTDQLHMLASLQKALKGVDLKEEWRSAIVSLARSTITAERRSRVSLLDLSALEKPEDFWAYAAGITNSRGYIATVPRELDGLLDTDPSADQPYTEFSPNVTSLLKQFEGLSPDDPESPINADDEADEAMRLGVVHYLLGRLN